MVFFFLVYGSIWLASFQGKGFVLPKWVWMNQKRKEMGRERSKKKKKRKEKRITQKMFLQR